MWPEEAAAVQESGRSLTELRSVGPFTALGDGFITYAHARTVVDAHPEWRAVARADHRIHTDETDGGSTIEERAEAAASLGRERIAITDHLKTLRITNGMDEARVERLRIVAAEGAWISRGTDAHAPGELVFLDIGIAATILAGVSRDRVLDLLSAHELGDQVGLVRATKKREVVKGTSNGRRD
jgi:hypothetical protein